MGLVDGAMASAGRRDWHRVLGGLSGNALLLTAALCAGGCMTTYDGLVRHAVHRELLPPAACGQVMQDWCAEADHSIGFAGLTGSMEPLIKGWDTLLLAQATAQSRLT